MSKHNNARKGELVALASPSKGDKKYEIRRGRKGFTCSCMGFRFKKGEIGSLEKRCKHLVKLADMASGNSFTDSVLVINWEALASLAH